MTSDDLNQSVAVSQNDFDQSETASIGLSQSQSSMASNLDHSPDDLDESMTSFDGLDRSMTASQRASTNQ